jgi:hypothetical protein
VTSEREPTDPVGPVGSGGATAIAEAGAPVGLGWPERAAAPDRVAGPEVGLGWPESAPTPDSRTGGAT